MNYLNRKHYEVYLAALGGANDPDFLQSCRDEYPLRSAAAIGELRKRGLDVDYTQLR